MSKPPENGPSLDGLDHLVLTVRDLRATCAFYRDVLGMRIEAFSANGGLRTALRFGAQKINLHEAGHEFDPKADQPTPGSADLCFLTSDPLPVWLRHLDACDVDVIDGPVARTGAEGPITSIYLRDPDGNLIEVATRD